MGFPVWLEGVKSTFHCNFSFELCYSPFSLFFLYSEFKDAFHLWYSKTFQTKETIWLIAKYFGSKIFFLGGGGKPAAVEVPRLRVESELQLPAYTTAAATRDDAGCIGDLHHSSWQHCILNPLSKARDGTHILMDTSWICNLLSHNGNSES